MYRVPGACVVQRQPNRLRAVWRGGIVRAGRAHAVRALALSPAILTFITALTFITTLAITTLAFPAQHVHDGHAGELPAMR